MKALYFLLFAFLLACSTEKAAEQEKAPLAIETATEAPQRTPTEVPESPGEVDGNPHKEARYIYGLGAAIGPDQDSATIDALYRRPDTALTTLFQQEERNVLDYFVALPEYLFQCDLADWTDTTTRKNRIRYQNLSAGYIRAEYDDEQDLVVVLFKDRMNHNDIIAVAPKQKNCFAELPCGPSRRFFILNKDGGWVDYSESLQAVLGKEDGEVWKLWNKFYQIELPEKGTDILLYRCATNGGFEIAARLSWQGDHFEAEES